MGVARADGASKGRAGADRASAPDAGADDAALVNAETFTYQHPMPLRFRDLDYLGHVTAAEYLAMFEEGRAAWLSDRLQTDFPAYVVARQEIDFDRELRMHQGPVTLKIQLTRLGTKSLEVSETLESRDGTIHARSRATLVMWNPHARRSRKLTGGERAVLERAPAGSPLP